MFFEQNENNLKQIRSKLGAKQENKAKILVIF